MCTNCIGSGSRSDLRILRAGHEHTGGTVNGQLRDRWPNCLAPQAHYLFEPVRPGRRNCESRSVPAFYSRVPLNEQRRPGRLVAEDLGLEADAGICTARSCKSSGSSYCREFPRRKHPRSGSWWRAGTSM